MKPRPIKKYIATLKYIRTPRTIMQIVARFRYTNYYDEIIKMKACGIEIIRVKLPRKSVTFQCTMTTAAIEKAFGVYTPRVSLIKRKQQEIEHNGAPWYVITSELKGLHINA